jgi:hypothetical protein
MVGLELLTVVSCMEPGRSGLLVQDMGHTARELDVKTTCPLLTICWTFSKLALWGCRFIEGDFDNYVERMRQPHVWGGEPELLMLSHVLEYDSDFGWLDFQTLSFACPCSYHIAERWRRASAVCVNKGILCF